MDTSNLVESAATFFRDHTLWAILIVLMAVLLSCWKPKDMFKLAKAGLVLGAIIYVVSFVVDLTSRGIDESGKLKSTPSVKVD